jgi:hypothetical protein
LQYNVTSGYDEWVSKLFYINVLVLKKLLPVVKQKLSKKVTCSSGSNVSELR